MGDGSTQIRGCWGIVVGPFTLTDGGVMWAEVVPAPRRNWRPWPGRGARWWYEVHSNGADDVPTTWAYGERGSGGSFTFRRCVDKARAACYYLAYSKPDEDRATPPSRDARA